MTDTATTAQRPPQQPNSYNPIANETFLVGTAVTPLDVGGHVAPGNAGSILGALVSGIAVTPGVAGNPVVIRYAGLVSLTTAEWDAITGSSGGLDAGSAYYLSDAVDGRITLARPSTPGHFVTQVGIALSETDFLVQIGPAAQIV